MSLKNFSKEFSIQKGLKNWLQSENLSAAKELEEFIKLDTQSLNKIKDKFSLDTFTDNISHTYQNFISRNGIDTIKIRINNYIVEAICTMVGLSKPENETRAEQRKRHDKAIKTALCIQKIIHEDNSLVFSSLHPTTPLLYVHGNKQWFENEFKEFIKQLPKYITNFYDIFGGSGYLSELAKDSERFLKVIYNDDDLDKHNFLNVLVKSPSKLKSLCLGNKNDIYAETFVKDNNTLNNLLKAAKLFFRFEEQKERSTIINVEPNRLDDMIMASELFKNIHRIKKDGLKLIESLVQHHNTFIVVDPPYIRTKNYKNRKTNNPEKDFSESKQEKLCKTLLKSKGIWIYHCRATATRGNKKEEVSPKDVYIRAFSEDMFANKGLFVCDFPYGNKGTIERVISNFCFKSFSSFEFKNEDDNPLFFKK